MTDAIVSPPLVAALLGGIVLFAAVKLFWGAALWAKRSEHRVGDRWGRETVEVTEWSGSGGYVSAGGELWRAISKDPLRAGNRVVVAKAKGLTLEVKKA